MAVVLAGPALAQNSPPPAPSPGYESGPPTPAEQSDRFRQDLRLRPDQERALQDFVAAMQPASGQAEHFRDEARREATLPTPQRLDAMMARMDEMRAALSARMTATKAFYAQLTPPQRAIFDQMPPPGQASRSPPR
ncbi:MAG TPA: Spy/CpxP family protein refolding chaperone [Caulobacteraceae bacterium]|nr:Spy/CpxP family protein refolding chaperone [Caulobacteraceae bacterium]